MATDAQKRAHAAHLKKLKEGGWVRASFWLSPKMQAKIAATMKKRKCSRQAAIELAIMASRA